MLVAHEDAWEQASFAEYLKAVADAHYRSARVGELSYRSHDRRESGQSSCAEVVPIRKAAWDYQAIETGAEVSGLFVPDVLYVVPQHMS